MNRNSTEDNILDYGINPQAVARPDKYATNEAISEEALFAFQNEQNELEDRIDREMEAVRGKDR